MPLNNRRSRRIVDAVLSSMDVWIDCAERIADECPPGSKGRALHLAHNLMQSRDALVRLADRDCGDSED